MVKQNKLIIAIFLLFSSSAICKEHKWMAVGGSKSAVIYLDVNNISYDDNIVKVWGLINHHADIVVNNISFRSMIYSDEYDCRALTYETKQWFDYSGEMGKGSIVYSSPYNSNNKESIVPGTIYDGIKDIVCKGK